MSPPASPDREIALGPAHGRSRRRRCSEEELAVEVTAAGAHSRPNGNVTGRVEGEHHFIERGQQQRSCEPGPTRTDRVRSIRADRAST